MKNKIKKSKFITKSIMKDAIVESLKKFNPKYMIKNPVMFVVEIGLFISLLSTIFPNIFGDKGSNLRSYDFIVALILFITVLFANFAEAIAEGRGRAQAETLKETRKDTSARLLGSDGNITVISASELKKGDIVMHSYFGKARVERVEQDKLSLIFNNKLLRSFYIDSLKFNNLIKRE